MAKRAPIGNLPTVSVVMPVFNAAGTLSRAIDSIRSQSFTNWELLVLDDQSEDDSLEIARAAAVIDERVKPLPLEHRGLAGTLNVGLEFAKAELVARMDADDLSLPHRFEQQVSFLRRHPQVAVVGGAAELVCADGALDRQMRNPCDPPVVAAALEKANPLIHPSVMMRREVVREAGGYRLPFPPSEDYDLWLRVSEGHDLANLPDVILEYRIGGKQESVVNSAQQVLSVLAARLCRFERSRGRPDPLDGDNRLVTREWLIAQGAGSTEVDRAILTELAHRSWWFASIGLLEEAEAIGKGIEELRLSPSSHRSQRFLSRWSRFRVAALARQPRRAALMLLGAMAAQPREALTRLARIGSRRW
jgi:glycosyltransferase involved in cell wall biosynthesis